MISNQFLILVVGPSGVGKNTLINEFLEKNPNFTFLITGTARPKRDYEIEGVHRYFYTVEEFKRGIENEDFYEHAIVHRTHYGVPKKSIKIPLENGKSIIGEIDYQGAKTFLSKKQELPCNLITIFVNFEDESQIRNRILERGDTDEQTISIRIESMRKELEVKDDFDSIVISYENQLEKTYQEFEKVVFDLMKKYSDK